MKKYLILFPITILSLFADVAIDPGSYHIVERQVMITNLSSFPNDVLFSCNTDYPRPPTAPVYNKQMITENEPIKGGTLFFMEKSLFESNGGLDAIDCEKMVTHTKKKIENVLGSGDVWYMYAEGNFSTVATENYYYEVDVNESALSMKLKKRVISYNNGDVNTSIAY